MRHLRPMEVIKMNGGVKIGQVVDLNQPPYELDPAWGIEGPKDNERIVLPWPVFTVRAVRADGRPILVEYQCQAHEGCSEMIRVSVGNLTHTRFCEQHRNAYRRARLAEREQARQAAWERRIAWEIRRNQPISRPRNERIAELFEILGHYR